MNRFILCVTSELPLVTGKRFSGGWYRSRRGLPAMGNEWGPLTDLPDYSFPDGKIPKITTVGQGRRALQQYEYTKRIMKLSSEICLSHEEFKRQRELAECRQRELRRSLLTPKGTKNLE
uniref:Large ribosomal subunit protein mL52 n=1 Tax=Schistocephalus solidus TaxID=70667 RepID=A0A0X3NU65_SCHSO